MTATFDAIATGTDIQRRIGVKTSRDEPLARFTTMRVGGPADLFASVHNAFELKAIVRFARSRGLAHVVLGRGSDVIISDAGVRGLVVQDRAEGSKVVGDRSKWERHQPFLDAIGGNPIQILDLRTMLSRIAPQLSTTLASTEVGRLLQLFKASGIKLD